MYSVKVKSNPNLDEALQQYEIDFKEDHIFLNNEIYTWDMIRVKENSFHILKDNLSYRAEIIKIDFEQKQFEVKVNGKKFEVALQDKFDILLEKLGMNSMASAALKEIKAPMPGLILDIRVNEGDEVQKGDVVMILEAMKMENVIKSPGDGIVKSVMVDRGDSVEKNNVLIEF
ncbi:acetyl-CoA carboxylase biotin carboxyl carrier protein subunit [Fulvivirgaceae bacterium BMA10]|uniref:Acetyl-CoA carboxylase biotin carboxyl carrier protein subunit n=1 Tax=Splendidivirga corallicola TaxID=3051826 RepID=A0ABT8KWL7_9BACT|nr:acetyl-CoA carboxylase biotin carboxyl carrier protein subunit [Fulvivirgaceae bacterium BMA10]